MYVIHGVGEPDELVLSPFLSFESAQEYLTNLEDTFPSFYSTMDWEILELSNKNQLLVDLASGVMS